MSDSIRSKLIRLAYARPDLRPDLLNLLRERTAAVIRPPKRKGGRVKVLKNTVLYSYGGAYAADIKAGAVGKVVDRSPDHGRAESDFNMGSKPSTLPQQEYYPPMEYAIAFPADVVPERKRKYFRSTKGLGDEFVVLYAYNYHFTKGYIGK